jgi:predicted dehydrogenase
MGPYYLTALLNLLGPVRRINGVAKIEIPDRVITSEPLKGKKIDVQTPDHIMGTMEFMGMPGAVGLIGMSFAVRYRTDDNKQPITIFGTKGTLKVPDPNQFDGPVHVRTDEDADWREVPHMFPTGYGRSLGLADMAQAIRSKREPLCSGQQALAVVDLMEGFLDSSRDGKAFVPTVEYVRPPPLFIGPP